ncbi:MAG: hypothetical protein ABI824_19230 [Acidobacteriota bacterium]
MPKPKKNTPAPVVASAAPSPTAFELELAEVAANLVIRDPSTKKTPPPGWMSETPTISCLLLAQTDKAEFPQEVVLTVEEYEALKRHLAHLRGFDVPEVE